MNASGPSFFWFFREQACQVVRKEHPGQLGIPDPRRFIRVTLRMMTACINPGSDQLPLLDDELVETLPFAERSVFVSVVFREVDPSDRVTSTLTFSSVVDRPSSNLVVVVSFSLT